ncbi:MAG TPA: hypothetical protein VGM88_08105 [Kofleriaceae bacterium]|jgi:hypothetical protein
MKLLLVVTALAATGSVAHADLPAIDTADSTPAPITSTHLGGRNELSVFTPFDVSFGDSHNAWGVAGFGLALGKHVGDSLYVGAAVEEEMVVDNDNSTMHQQTLKDRFRAAGELRWYYYNATTTQHDDLGNPMRVPVHFSVGVRGGAQAMSLDAWGMFGDVTLGIDWDMKSMLLGVYASAGMGVIPRSEFMNDPSDVTEIDVTAGLRVGWLSRAL